MTVQELLTRLSALRAELDERHGEAWPAEAVEQYERATQECAAAIEAAERRAALEAQAQAVMQRAEVLDRHRAAQAAVPPPRTEERASRCDAFRRYLRGGPQALTADEQTRYLSADAEHAGWVLRAAAPDATGESVFTRDTVAPLVESRRRPGVMRELCTVVPVGGPALVVPFVLPSGEFPSQQIQSTWPGLGPLSESALAAIGSAAQQRFEHYRIPIDWHQTTTMLVTADVIDDALVDVEAIVARLIERTFATGEDQMFLVGDGANKPLGILSDSAIQSVNTGSASGLTYDGLVDALAGVRAEYVDGATWLFHPLAVGQLLKLKDSSNRPLFAPGQTATELFGRPIRITGFLQAPANNAIIGVFGDFSQYYIAERSGPTVRPLKEIFSPHLAIQAYARKGGRCVQPEALVKIKQAA